MSADGPAPRPVASTDTEPPVSELRRQIRAWRRRRASLSWWEAAQDAYTYLFAALVLGAMSANVLWGLRGMAEAGCTASCLGVRAAAPWLATAVAATAALGVSRLLGPVFQSPATGSWLLSTPVDRGEALRPSLLRALALGAVLPAALVSPVAVLSGTDALGTALATLTAALACVALVAFAADQQRRTGSAARWLTWTGAVATWLVLAWMWLAPAPTAPASPAVSTALGAVLVVASGAAATVLVVVALRGLAGTPRSALARTENAWPSLSGALATMDLTLTYDVLLSRRWAAVPGVRPRRGGPRGWWSLVHADLRRVVRAPQPWWVLVAACTAPPALAAAGLVRGTATFAALAGFLVGTSLMSGLRVVCRTRTVARLYPWKDWATRAAHLLVPALGLALLGVATALSVAPALGADAWLLGAATAASATAAAFHWVAAPPPDYARPLLSTPAGGLPPGMVGGLLKGFDVWLPTALLLLVPGWGAVASLVLSLGVVLWHVSGASPLSGSRS
ncbi:MAG: DUF6297 family protein [Nocardioides sp.]|uniref:DUF6297 family protein n=1 Tax=Nocardioides sp. TaxID=35761 RepID=UPI003F0E9F13